MFNLLTVHDTYILSHKLAKIDAELYKTNTEVDTLLNSVFAQDEKDDFIAHCDKEKLSYTTKEGVKDCLDSLKKDLDEYQAITLVVAFKPTIEATQKIHEFLSRKIKSRFVIDFQVNTSLIGGAVIEYDGKYKDFSIKNLKKARLESLKETDSN